MELEILCKARVLVQSAVINNDAQLPDAQETGEYIAQREMNVPSCRSATKDLHSTGLEHVLEARPMTLVGGRWMQVS